MRLRRSRPLFQALDARFPAGEGDGDLQALVPDVRQQGHLTKTELLAVSRWKSPRPLARVKLNAARDVQELTACALGSGNERLRIGAPLLLQGVSWPTASAILHFFQPDPYPVLDFRAVWSLGLTQPSAYSFEFWWEYVLACRELSRALNLSMRTVDRALWQFSKENM